MTSLPTGQSPIPITPGIAPSFYYFGQPYFPGSTTTLAPSAGTIYFAPVPVGAATAITRLGFEVTTAGSTGSKCRMGLYSTVNARPGILLADSGDVASDSTGTKEAVVSLTLQPGWYWLGIQTNAQVPTLRRSNADDVYIIGSLLGCTGTTSTVRGITVASTYGSMPTDLTAASLTAYFTAPFAMWIRNA